MTNTKRIVSGAIIFAGLLVVSAPAHADWRNRNQRRDHREYREDLRDLRSAQRELDRDLRNGAGGREIARDRAAIARERQELSEYRRDGDDRHAWSRDRWRRNDDDRSRRSWWNRGWHGGWWR
jgi:hypothetical protein